MPHSDPASPDGEGSAERGPSTEQRLADVVTAYRALQAENESYRERVSRNAERRFAQRHERLLLKFIDILDNLDRALDASELSHTGGAMIEGLILVRTQLLQTLQEEGLERIPVVGIAYDPEVAEAVGTQPVEDPDHHHVVMKDIRRGYRLNGRLARAAQVIVGEYAGELSEPEPASEDSGRVEVVGHGSENTGELAALAAQAAAAIEAAAGGGAGDAAGADDTGEATDGDDPDAEGLLGDVDLEAAAREAAAMAEGEADAAGGEETGSTEDGDEGFAGDVDLEAAAREAAAMAEGDASGGDQALEDNEAISIDDDEDDLASDGSSDDLISDEESLEQAAREAAALVGEDTDDGSEEEPGSAAQSAAGSSDDAGAAPEKKPATPPSHPLDDVDPSAFEDPETGA